MADVTKIDLADGTSLNIKDTVAREKLEDVGASLDYTDSTLSLLSSSGEALSSVEIQGGGTPTDAYTKAETNGLLEKKQDVLTPLTPLQIQDKLISPLENFAVTDTTVLPNKPNTSTTPTSVLTLVDGKVGLDLSYSHITLPYVNGAVLVSDILQGKSLLNTSYSLWYGYYAGERFVPVISMRKGFGTSASAVNAIFYEAETATDIDNIPRTEINQFSSSKTTVYAKNSPVNKFTASAVAYTAEATVLSNVPEYAFASQVYLGETTGELCFGTWHNVTGNYIKSYTGTVIASAGAMLLFNRITHVIYIPDREVPIAKTDLKYYKDDVYRIHWDLASLGVFIDNRTNSLDLEHAQTQKQLSVGVDNTTIKVNNDGNLEAQYPAELNGVKLFPITQAAYDELAVKDPNTLYIIKQETV